MSRFFVHRAWLAGGGLAAGLAGMAMAWRSLIWVGVGLLGAAFALRMVERRLTAS